LTVKTAITAVTEEEEEEEEETTCDTDKFFSLSGLS